MAEVTFDYQNLIEVEGGLQSGELDELGPRLSEAAEGLLGDPPGFMRLPKTGEYAEASARAAEEIRASGATDFIHVGIGGSALGPMALHKALGHPRCRRPRRNLGQRRYQVRVDGGDDGELPGDPGIPRRLFGRLRIPGA